MRSIPESLKAKMKSLSQTKANNADPRLEAIISRHKIPIPSYKLWQTSKVADFSASRVSVAVSRPDYRRVPQKIYVAGIDSGTAKIYSAKYDGANAPKSWALELTINNVADISIAFPGRFRPYKHRTEFFTTDEKPWIFWIDTSGNLYAQHWNDSPISIGSSATSVSATMGIDSVQGEWGYGLLVAWTTIAGAVFYAQYFDGVWSDGITVPQAPANSTEIVIARAADWRLVFLVKNSSGNTTALFFRSIAISMSNYERVEIRSAKVTTAKLTAVDYLDTSTTERVEVAGVSVTEAVKYSVLAPEPRSAYNISDGEEEENWGKYVMLEFFDDVYDFVAADFTIKGTSGLSYGGLSISRPTGKDKNWLLIEFQDFNNAPGDCTITYTPGTLSSGVTEAEGFTIDFEPDGLVPTAVERPEVVEIINIEEVDENA